MEYRDELGLYGKIAVTQPRRIAARSVSARVADMVGCEVGESIGYQVRFDDSTSKDTDIAFMTDGVLLRKIQFDPCLSEYCIVMVDEAHERSLNIDLSLGLLKSVNISRLENGMEPLRIVVSSATIERNRFAEYIGSGDRQNSVEIPGKMYPVEVFYEKDIPLDYDYTFAAAEKVKQIVGNNEEGDILIFMPGKKEINETIGYLEHHNGSNNYEILPLHAELTPEEQGRIFEDSDKRKIVVSTNIAETSVTIDGIKHVIDSGLIKQIQFDAHSGIEQLVLVEHSKSGLEQRKGRAGRTAPGKCYRLFTEESYEARPQYQIPEIQRANLASIVLAMKKVGIEDVGRFDFIDPPKKDAIYHALDTLQQLGALDDFGYLTDVGEFMIELGIEPRLGRMILEATRSEDECINEICTIASFMEGKTLFVRPLDEEELKVAERKQDRFKQNCESDFEVILNVWKEYIKNNCDPYWAMENYLNEKVLEEAVNLRAEIIDVLASRKIYVNKNAKIHINREAIGKAITAGLIGNLMRSRGRVFSKMDGTTDEILIHPSSTLKDIQFKTGTLLVSDEIFANNAGRTFASTCLVVNPKWICDIAPQMADQIFGNRYKKGNKKHNWGGGNNQRYRNNSFKGKRF
jgi:HrpA-like RNA helicase